MECLLNPGEFKEAIQAHNNSKENVKAYLYYLEYKRRSYLLGKPLMSYSFWKKLHIVEMQYFANRIN